LGAIGAGSAGGTTGSDAAGTTAGVTGAAGVEQGRLQRVLDYYLDHSGSFWMLWPSSRHASAKLRVFIDHMGERLFPADTVP